MRLFRKKPEWTFDNYFKKLRGDVTLGRFSEGLLFDDNVEYFEDKFKNTRPTSISKIEEEKVSRLYKQSLDVNGRRIHYTFIPAIHESRGLVVIFHPWNGYGYTDHIKALGCYDVLAPFDNFGPNRWSCGFWGLNGDPFLVEPIQSLIQKFLKERKYTHWFTMGGSVGGFGALYHGILGGCDGMYIMTPQIDIRAMSVQDLKKGYVDDIYTPMLSSQDPAFDPDLFALAREQETLPPLYLIQALYDTINPFEQHAYRLQEIYHEKRGWYGLRLLPAIGHRADGSQEEAEYLFLLIQKKKVQKKFQSKKQKEMELTT
ncbi:MAG: hypothetical protein V4507_07225 [Verrucomicrobiota bacterium]